MTDLLDELATWSDDELVTALAILEDAYFPAARQTQRPPDGDWLAWLILAGRGFGKTRTGAEWVVEIGRAHV